MMNMHATRYWTFNSLVVAFLDLFVAYFLLCGSTIAFFAGKFLNLFGFSLPSPYNLGNPSSDYRSLLVDYPTDKVSAVQYSVTRKFPFDSVFFRVQNYNANCDGLNFDRGDCIGNDNGDGFRELEGEASCSSKSDARKRIRNGSDDCGARIDKERGFDMKGKGVLNYRMRGGFTRRRRGSFDNGKYSSVSSSPNWISCVDQQSNDREHNGGIEDSSSLLSGANSCNYEAETPMVMKSDHQDIAFNDIKKRIPINEEDKDKMIVLLTRELEEEQAARAALYSELDQERNAAATAADEAMSMILRLQEEKASIEMESRQYQRMIEEKSAYDEEEMNILKEIVLRREREKHFLEKEVEAYRQMNRLENDQLYAENNQDLTDYSKGYEDVDNPKQDVKTIAIVGEEEDDGLTTDSRVYDVHVIDNEPKLTEKSNGNKKVSDQNKSFSETNVGLPPMSSKSLRRNSTSALDNERTRLDTEVDWLRERLRIVQEGREKLNVSIENREKESLQLQLLEDIGRQLREIRMLTETPWTARQASLPLPSSKGLTKKRRCRSVSSGPAKSC